MGIVVDIDKQRSDKPSLDDLTAIVDADMAAVNALIIKRMESPVALIPQLAGHVV
ncbi:MAG: polyprenyl synthetase family protein, partial [Rhodospirillaceae bacterium]|nr:polyprenyl synthetase family protein [Rhodospirillaceae bacterium]